MPGDETDKIYVNFRIRMYLFSVLVLLVILPLFAVILLYETKKVEPGENWLVLIPVFMLLSARSITGILEHILIKQNLMKIKDFAEKIKKGQYETKFSLPIQKDEENYYVQVLRSLESLARVIKGQNNMLICSLNETRSKAELMKELAEKDALTGLFNRRHFDTVFISEAQKACRNGYAITLILADCDRFKQVNDTFGHDAGDKVLKQLGKILMTSVRSCRDIPFRFGGDEFGIIMPHADAAAARRVVHRLMEEYACAERLGTTLSISGVTAVFRNCESVNDELEKIIKIADSGIYKVKEKGGNGSEFYELSCFSKACT